MSAKITRNQKEVYPTFNFSEHHPAYPYEAITAQMAESSRNLLVDIERALQDMRHTLHIINRRLATKMPLTKRSRR